MVRISVTDTGCGISPESIKLLFNPFERIGADKSGVLGTSLGLVVVKKLVDALDVKIGVESVVDEGSKFWVEFPLDVETEN